MAEFIHRRDFLSAEKGEETCVKGWPVTVGGYFEERRAGGWQIRRTHSDQSPSKENEGRYRKGFRDASARNIKVRAISSGRIQMKCSTYWRLYRFLVDTYQFAREIRLFDKNKKKREKEKTVCCLNEHELYNAKIEFQKRACEILQVLGFVRLLLFYFNLI